MPLHAQILCIGGNGLFALFFGLTGLSLLGKGDMGPAGLLLALAGAAGYSLWILLKFRRYLGAEASMERELHIEQLREEIDKLKANNVEDKPPTLN
jgi:hypothetical protein